jgi:hypothetical protein
MDESWKKLRRQVQRERRKWHGDGMSKDSKIIAASLHGAYTSVLTMMDRIEKNAAQREP